MIAERSTTDREIVTSRVIDAPRDLVFEAFTDIAHLSQWWGPRGFSTTTHRNDFREDGEWLFTMHGPDGTDYPNWVGYRVIRRPELIAYDHGERRGEPWFHAVVSFAAVDGKTRITLRSTFPTREALARAAAHGAVEGAQHTLERLSDQVAARSGHASRGLVFTTPSDVELRATRTFDAPRELVFDAFSRPEQLRRWWGREGSTLAVCEVDFRPGGRWRFVERNAKGIEHAFRGTYQEIVRPEKLVYTFEYEGAPGEVSTENLAFSGYGGRTTLIISGTFPSRAERDAMLNSGMGDGAAESFNRLERLLAGR